MRKLVALRLIGTGSNVLVEDNYFEYGEIVVQDVEIRRNVMFPGGFCAPPRASRAGPPSRFPMLPLSLSLERTQGPSRPIKGAQAMHRLGATGASHPTPRPVQRSAPRSSSGAPCWHPEKLTQA
jgi:hypothetical protein